MKIEYITGFSFAFFLCLFLTPLVRNFAYARGWFDHPGGRKQHQKPIPRLGGVAITVAFVIPFLAYFNLNRQLWGLLGGVITLFIVGLIDDIHHLSAITKLIWQVVAACLVLAGGIGIIYLSNPLGGVFVLNHWVIPMTIANFHFNILPIANAVSLIWILGMINAVNLLDGLDGLATGISAIAALVLFVLALTPALANPSVALLSIILLGALLGFLPYNFFPSSIFMGDSGAYVIGLVLALLSIYSGSKIAVGALVLGFAVIDMVWTMLRRLMRRQSPFAPDRKHLHHRMVDSGLFSHRKAVLVLYLMAMIVAAAIFLAGAVAGFSILVLALITVMSVLRILGPIQTRRL